VFPVIAIKDTLRGVIRFALENGRFSDTDRGATIKLSHMRKNAASAIAAGAKVRFGPATFHFKHRAAKVRNTCKT